MNELMDELMNELMNAVASKRHSDESSLKHTDMNTGCVRDPFIIQCRQLH